MRPERGTEIEVGFEASSLDGRVSVDATYYHKQTRDALIPVAIAPSSGFTGNTLTNLGTIANSGIELRVNGALVERRSVTVHATVSMSTNSNELISFGDNRAPIIFGSYAPSQRYQVGYALGGMWAQKVQRNSDGTPVLVAGRPVLDTASVYMGPSVPTREMAFSSSITIFQKIHFRGLLDWKTGHYQFNVKDWRRDRAGVSWQTANPAADPNDVVVRQFASKS